MALFEHRTFYNIQTQALRKNYVFLLTAVVEKKNINLEFFQKQKPGNLVI
jgi:hypothetical protein